MRGILTLMALILSSAMASAQPAPQTACDSLAGLWLLPRAEGMAQVYAIDDAPAAIAACDAARAQYPSEPAFALLLARALMAADPMDTRAVALVTGAQAELPVLGAAQLAAYYENGLAGLPASERIARDFYARACEGWPAPNARPGCAGLARMMIEGRGGPADESGGFEMLQSLCSEGWAMACTDLAQQQELRGEASDSQVTALLARACDGGDLFGCSVLGFRYETETGAPYDIARARALYERACDGGEMLGCGLRHVGQHPGQRARCARRCAARHRRVRPGLSAGRSRSLRSGRYPALSRRRGLPHRAPLARPRVDGTQDGTRWRARKKADRSLAGW